VLTGCVALGWRFGPGVSCRAVGIFAEPPVVVHRSDGYFLAWTYGKDAFYFVPGYQAREGKLFFSLQGSSSSGRVAGRRAEERIEGEENLRALIEGGALWWEEDDARVPLAIVEQPEPRAPGILLQ
jgi:hypothetical protein